MKMVSEYITLLLIIICLTINVSKAENPDTMEKRVIKSIRSEYVFVRYWIHYAEVPRSRNYTDRPFVIWLPDMIANNFSSTIYYEEFFYNLPDASGLNILFIEAPLYTRYDNFVASDVIGSDVAIFLANQFETSLKEFLQVPLYIFGEGFSGKLAVDLTDKILLWSGNSPRYPSVNLKSLNLISPWLIPADHIKAWPDALVQVNLINDIQYKILKNLTSKARYNPYCNSPSPLQLTKILEELSRLQSGISFDNTADPERKKSLTEQDLLYIMEVINKHNFDIANEDIKYKAISFYNFEDDCYSSYVDKVKHLMGFLRVNVISGDRSLLCPLNSTAEWIQKVGAPTLSNGTLYANNLKVKGSFRINQNLHSYYILEAGQSIVRDNPRVLSDVMRYIFDVQSYKIVMI